MDKDAIMVLRPVAVGVTAAVLACAALVMGAQAAKADTVSQGGVVISLDGSPVEGNGVRSFEVSSYRIADTGEVVSLDEPFTVTIPDSAM